MNKKISPQMRVLITAGPTREWMDPVRFLSNPSSGAMGLNIARALKKNGAFVTVVLGPTRLTPPSGIQVVRVETALEMFAAVKKHLRRTDALIASAAVGDWRFARVAAHKLKKSASITVRLEKNPDILAWAGRQKNKQPGLKLVGFALETQRIEPNAAQKLKQKNLDLIIANDPASFGSDTIHTRWLERNKPIQDLGRLKKKSLASKLAKWLETSWKTASVH
jgi:phosphopantothenoylcysteine decarboxylase/phosphopantothenate--cysteine ligase